MTTTDQQKLEKQIKIDDLHQRIYSLPDFPEDALEVRQILSAIVALIETNILPQIEEAKWPRGMRQD